MTEFPEQKPFTVSPPEDGEDSLPPWQQNLPTNQNFDDLPKLCGTHNFLLPADNSEDRKNALEFLEAANQTLYSLLANLKETLQETETQLDAANLVSAVKSIKEQPKSCKGSPIRSCNIQ